MPSTGWRLQASSGEWTTMAKEAFSPSQIAHRGGQEEVVLSPLPAESRPRLWGSLCTIAGLACAVFLPAASVLAPAYFLWRFDGPHVVPAALAIVLACAWALAIAHTYAVWSAGDPLQPPETMVRDWTEEDRHPVRPGPRGARCCTLVCTGGGMACVGFVALVAIVAPFARTVTGVRYPAARAGPDAECTGGFIGECPSWESVVVVGGGPAGMAAAWALQLGGRKRVTLLEAGAAVGGHSYTQTFHGQTVDMGFIFGNRNYAYMLALVEALRVRLHWHPITFSVGCPSNRCPWSNLDPEGPGRWASEIDRFLEELNSTRTTLGKGMPPLRALLQTSGSWLDERGFSKEFREEVLAGPMSLLFVRGGAAPRPHS